MPTGAVVPAGSVARGAEEAISATGPDPAVLELSEAFPWPLAAMEGIQKNLGLLAAMSKSVPDWVSVGVVARLPIWYQRSPSRSPPEPPTPVESTRML